MTSGRTTQHGPEATRHMQELRDRLPEDVIEGVFAVPGVRAEAVARARALLGTTRWCRAEEVASELVDCFVANRVP